MTAVLVALALLAPITADDPDAVDRAMFNAGAVATQPAVRLNPPVIVAQIDPPVPHTTNEDIIRAVWPDNLEAHALRIAYRESRYQCCVRTYCCFGLMQINWIAHHAWINDEFGLTSGYDLYDPWINATVAYRLYQKDGWQPWAL